MDKSDKKPIDVVVQDGNAVYIRWMSGNYACTTLLISQESVECFLKHQDKNNAV